MDNTTPREGFSNVESHQQDFDLVALQIHVLERIIAERRLSLRFSIESGSGNAQRIERVYMYDLRRYQTSYLELYLQALQHLTDQQRVELNSVFLSQSHNPRAIPPTNQITFL